MINFASLFNQFRSQNNSGLGQIIDQPGIKMGRLLDQDTFMNEYKSANPKIVQFMKYERYLELIEFVTVVGNPNDKKRSYKYPLSASDILCIDNSQALQFFMPEKPLVEETKVIQTVIEDIEIQIQVPIENSEPVSPAQTNQESQAKESQKKTNRDFESQTAENTLNEKQQEVPQEQNPQPKQQQKSSPNQVKSEAETEKGPAGQKQVEKQLKKIIKQEERKVQRIQRQQLTPLLSKLLLYFEEPVNYTLAGYVSKILAFLFNKKPAELLKYIFEEGLTDKILNHAESRSVGDFLVKILTIESTLYLQKRGQLLKDLLEKLSVSSDVHIMSNLSAYVCEVIEKIAANFKGNNKVPQFNTTFFSLQIVSQVIKNVMSDEENVSIYNAPILFTYLTNVPFVLPEDTDTVAAFKSLLQNFIDKSCQKLQASTESRPKVGIGRMKIVEILRFTLKENILEAKEIIGGKTRFFPILFSLTKKYSMNNLLHNEIIKILDIALAEPQTSPLSKVLFDGNVLLNFIIEEAKDDIKIRNRNSVYKTRKGYIAHIINLFLKLREFAQKNSNIKALTENQQFINVFQSFVEKEMFKTKKNLAGYTMKKEQKHEIMFQKEDIIASYLTFFQKCPSAVFQRELEPEPVNTEHPDLVQELQKQLQQNLHVKTKEEQKAAEVKQEMQQLANQKTPEVVDGETEQIKNHYWVQHLNYNVDDLLAEL